MNKLQPSFEAQAFHPSLGNEVVAGRVGVHGWALRFESGDASLEVPLDRLQVDLGKEDDERVFFSDPQQPGLRIVTPDASLLEQRDSPQVARIRERLSARLTRQEIRRRVRLVLWVLGACVLVAWLGMLATGAMVRSIVARAPPEWEQQLGNAAVKDLRGRLPFTDDTNAVARVAALAAPLLRTLPGGSSAYRLYVAEMDKPNACALPGGHIIVTRGLLGRVERPEELLGVLAHEVAHVTQRHGLRQIIASAGPIVVLQVFLSGQRGALGVLAGGSALLVSRSFSQEYEIEADDVGWGYLVAAGIDPRGMTDVFRKLKAYEQQTSHSGALPQAFQSHPAMAKRIARLEAKWRKLPDKARFNSSSETSRAGT